jgi:hypothetical protein
MSYNQNNPNPFGGGFQNPGMMAITNKNPNNLNPYGNFKAIESKT